MAKSQRSKIKRRWRALKRTHLETTKVPNDIKELNQKLEATISNRQYRTPTPKNGFLHPEDPNAHFPQYKPQTLIDFRSSALPYSGNQFSGALRKKTKESATVVQTIRLDEETDMKDEREQKAVVEPQHNDEDDLINAMEGVKMMSKNERRRINKAKGMEIIPVETSEKKIKKSRRKKEQPRRKSKKLITF